MGQNKSKEIEYSELNGNNAIVMTDKQNRISMVLSMFLAIRELNRLSFLYDKHIDNKVNEIYIGVKFGNFFYPSKTIILDGINSYSCHKILNIDTRKGLIEVSKIFATEYYNDEEYEDLFKILEEINDFVEGVIHPKLTKIFIFEA